MLKPQLPNLPGVGAVTDTLDFVKNLWGSMSVPGMSIPGMSAPTLSVEELDKKIADLKAVEAWLNVNMSMLRGTVQALEIQRGTIATLKSMGATLAAAVKQPGADEKSVLAAAPYASAFFAQPGFAAAAAQPEPEPAPPKVEPEASLPAPNPAIWWNLLQDQFKQAVSNAMSSETLAGAGAMAQQAAARLNAATQRQGKTADTAKPAAAANPKAPRKSAAKPAAKAAAKAPGKAKPRAPRAKAAKS